MAPSSIASVRSRSSIDFVCSVILFGDIVASVQRGRGRAACSRLVPQGGKRSWVTRNFRNKLHPGSRRPKCEKR
eukprot:4077502-Prymnesium_polylepis.1